ncbi:hypothetical protein JK332_25220 [Klebsiella michiganensis]|uniref:hypothetical protein n=1 Tax=Klebsiella michiganensis TaxID=1134687 RepID=UPI00191DF021|nr:hypothetical protein [Klebsiella michiganensis]MBL0775059.1 hypothetical protein [Klebsiella michiganensis]
MHDDYKPPVNNTFDKEKLLEYFTNHTNKNGCPECGSKDVDIIAMRFSNGKTVVVDGVTLRSLPDSGGLVPHNKMLMQVTCSNCGYVKFYDINIIHKKINELYDGD